MKKELKKRLDAIETQYQFLFRKERFQEWLRTCPDCKGDYWGLTEIVPEEHKLECVFYVLDKLREEANITDPLKNGASPTENAS